ncbi:MAG: hypothetical protein JW827_09010 [Spirochaetes bacterium]|nr:hypothetical protein [Spirochaetota bacterium]
MPRSFLLFMILFFLSGCGGSALEKKVIPNTQTRRSMLIAGLKSEFKEPIINSLVRKYRDECRIELDSLKRLDNIESEDYDVILVIDECWNSMYFNFKTRKFLKNCKDKDKIVLFITAGDPDWTYIVDGIDAVTSASKKGKEKEIIEKIVNKINHILNK